MRTHLAFQLYGPMASWGDIAVGALRPTWDRPTKSAALGLVAAALGVRRDEADQLGELRDAFDFGCAVVEPGAFFQDFHTAHAPSSKPKGGIRPWVHTRRESLRLYEEQQGSSTAPNPIPSTRAYRAGSLAVVALGLRAGADPDLPSEVAQHLRSPTFVPYLGRKACPLALPLAPEVFESPTLPDAVAEAVRRYRPRWQRLGIGTPFANPQRARFYVEADGRPAPYDRAQRVERWDQPGDRERWEFQPRQEWEWTGSLDEGLLASLESNEDFFDSPPGPS